LLSSNVGIGTTNPAYRLDVNGDINFTGAFRQNGTPYIGSQWSNNSSNVFLLSSNVGIGTTNPAYRLDVNGDINFTGAFRQNGTPYIGSQWSNNSSNVFLLSSNVGIGVTNPLEALHVSPGKIFTNTQYLASSNDTSSIPSYSFRENSNTGMFHPSNDSLGFSTAGSEKVRIDNNGNVGIGVSTPSKGKLEVNGNISVFKSGEARYHLYNNGLVTEWMFGQKSGSSHNFTISRIVSSVENDCFSITSNGNVGIGTTIPSEVLHVVGKTFTTNQVLGYSNDTSNAPGFSWTDDSNTGMYHPATDALALVTGGVERLRVLSTGNVGIGTITPNYLFDVAGEARVQSNLYIGMDNNSSNSLYTTGRILFGGTFGDLGYSHAQIACRRYLATGENSELVIAKYNDGDGASGPDRIRLKAGAIAFDTYTGFENASGVDGDFTTSNIRMYIKSDGNVGIGTTTPSEVLHVVGKTFTTNQVLGYSNDTSNAPGFSWTDDSNTGMYHPATDALALVTGGVERLRVLSTGNVGIGTTTPSNLLDVNGVIATPGGTSAFITASNTPGDMLVKYYGGNGDRYGVGQYSSSIIRLFTSGVVTTGSIRLSSATNDTRNGSGTFNDHLTIVSGSGNVGIGTTTPSAKLDVAGDVKLDGNVGIGTSNPSYKLHTIGDIYASGDIIAFSDKRLKSNIQPISSPLDKIKLLKGYTYNRESTESTNKITSKYMGLIAQELENVIPEVISRDNDGFMSIAYGNLAGLFVEAIKELTTRIELLENRQ
jgi:hypothetical protein